MFLVISFLHKNSSLVNKMKTFFFFFRPCPFFTVLRLPLQKKRHPLFFFCPEKPLSVISVESKEQKRLVHKGRHQRRADPFAFLFYFVLNRCHHKKVSYTLHCATVNTNQSQYFSTCIVVQLDIGLGMAVFIVKQNCFRVKEQFFKRTYGMKLYGKDMNLPD